MLKEEPHVGKLFPMRLAFCKTRIGSIFSIEDLYRSNLEKTLNSS